MGLGDLLTPILKPVGDYFTERQKVKAQKNQNKHELMMAKHQAKINRLASGDATERDYDLLVLQQSASTIIDEIMILWVLAIVTSLFIPALAPYALAGFDKLAMAPMYFQLVFVGCFIAKLGLRFLFSGRTLFGSPVK